jgi:tetratricopeptide (TPR) repeat protein
MSATDMPGELERQLAAATDRQQRVDLLNAWARELRDIQPLRALACAQEAYSLAQGDPPYLEGQAESLTRLADCHIQLGKYDLALPQALEGLALAEAHGYADQRSPLLRTIGGIYEYLGDYPQALTHFQQALVLARQIGFRYIEMYVLRSSGRVHALQGRLDAAIPLLQQALQIAEEIEARAEVFECRRQLAEAYKQQGDFETALRYSEQHPEIE